MAGARPYRTARRAPDCCVVVLRCAPSSGGLPCAQAGIFRSSSSSAPSVSAAATSPPREAATTARRRPMQGRTPAPREIRTQGTAMVVRLTPAPVRLTPAAAYRCAPCASPGAGPGPFALRRPASIAAGPASRVFPRALPSRCRPAPTAAPPSRVGAALAPARAAARSCSRRTPMSAPPSPAPSFRTNAAPFVHPRWARREDGTRCRRVGSARPA